MAKKNNNVHQVQPILIHRQKKKKFIMKFLVSLGIQAI